MSTSPLQLIVTDKDTVADGVVALTLQREDGGPVPEWEPGAHIDLILDGPDGELIRQYSLCGDRGDTTSLQVAVLREPEGRGGSAYVHERLEAGAGVRVDGPRNHFELHPAAGYLFIAGGIGITPILPMIARAEERGAAWRLLYGGRTRSSMAFADRLLERYPGRVQICPQDTDGLLDLSAAVAATEADTAVYCCGPEPLLTAIEAVCGEQGRTLHLERFTAKDTAHHSGDGGFTVELESSGISVDVGADQTILDAVLAAGVDADFSCREGTCGTCEVAVCAGEPDHRDSVLDDDEREAGDAMMICVSRSLTPTLVIDL